MSAVEELLKIYQKNLLYFQEFYPDIYSKLSTHIENQRYELIIDDAGYFNIEVKANGSKIYAQNSDLIAQQSVDNCLEGSPQTKKAIFIGTLLGLEIEKLILKTDTPCVMIIEPDLELFKLSAFLIDYEALTKSRFAIFSIADTETELENKILEFVYTMFYYNDNIAFLKTINEYQFLLDKIKSTHQENIFYSLDTKSIKIPKINKNINIAQVSLKAKKQDSNEYLKIMEYEKYLKSAKNQNNEKDILLAYLNLGNIFFKQRHTAEAYHCYGKCIYSTHMEKDIYEAALHNYALINRSSNNAYKKTMQLLKEHIDKGTEDMSLISSYAELLYATNQYEAAEEFLKPYSEALKKEQNIISMISPLPIVYNSQDEIDKAREKLEQQLDELLLQDIKIPESKISVFSTFYLAYHNRNNKDILTKLSKLYEQTTPSITYTAKHCKKYKHSGKKIKLGIVSNHLIPNHPVVKFMKNIIDSFNKNSNYDLHIFTFSKKTKKIFSKNVHILTGSLKEQRELIAKYKLDIILYPEIGMHPATYILAHARLAPIQCMFGGHPVTSGIKNIDYFFSNKDIEIEGAKEQYSEKLVLFEKFIANYEKPIVPKEFITKELLGLQKDTHNYLIPAKLQKIHPDFDLLLGKILQKDKKALFIFFKDKNENKWDNFVKERLLNALDEKHVVFRPWADTTTFYSLLHHSDAVLEPIVFGYGTTAIEAFSIGTPIVTLPSNYPGGRVMNMYYKQMGYDELIASNKDEYVFKAVKLASNSSYKNSCKNDILKLNSFLYNNNDFTYELDTFFKEILSTRM